MDGVGTPIIGRPRPLPGHDTPNPAYHPHTLNYEEPDTPMGMHSTTQAFQFDVPFEQLFQLAIPAAQSVPKATVTFADPNRQVVTFDTPMSMMSWGENIVAGFIPSEGSTVVEVTCTTKGLPNLMQDRRNRKIIAQFVTALSNLAQTTAVEVTRS